MTTIFCSDRLEKWIGLVGRPIESDVESKLGSWNGHVFIIDGKRNIIFTNSKTAYSFVLLHVKKSALTDFNKLFKESFVKQLYNDLIISEKQEVKIRKWLNDIRFVKAQSKKVKTSIRDFIALIKQEAISKGGLNCLNALSLGYGLNNHFIGTKLKPGEKKFAIPKELMEILIK